MILYIISFKYVLSCCLELMSALQLGTPYHFLTILSALWLRVSFLEHVACTLSIVYLDVFSGSCFCCVVAE